VFKVYRRIGGRRHEPFATVGAFAVSGLAHGALVLPFLGWSYTIPTAFGCFGLLVSFGEPVSEFLHQARWHPLVNAATNVSLVAGCFSAGFRLDEIVRSC
jgi:hypothetical protein